MSASKEIKALGMPSVVYVAAQIGKDRDTIYKWYNKNYEYFNYIIHGVAYVNGFIK